MIQIDKKTLIIIHSTAVFANCFNFKLGNTASGYLPGTICVLDFVSFSTFPSLPAALDIYECDIPGMPKLTKSDANVGSLEYFFEQVWLSVIYIYIYIYICVFKWLSRTNTVETFRIEERRTRQSETIYWAPSVRSTPK